MWQEAAIDQLLEHYYSRIKSSSLKPYLHHAKTCAKLDSFKIAKYFFSAFENPLAQRNCCLNSLNSLFHIRMVNK
jgi:hypothetical protein